MFRFEYESTTNIVVGTMSDFLSVEEVRDYVRELARYSSDARRRTGYLLLLIDASAGTVQSSEVIAQFSKMRPNIQDPRDRMAVVAGTSLLKMQTRRTQTTDQEAVFSDVAAARAWIMQGAASQG